VSDQRLTSKLVPAFNLRLAWLLSLTCSSMPLFFSKLSFLFRALWLTL
jgi:hypothetical protein